jgi:hypothetical protein
VVDREVRAGKIGMVRTWDQLFAMLRASDVGPHERTPRCRAKATALRVEWLTGDTIQVRLYE